MSISKVWYVGKIIQCIVNINCFEEQRHARTVFVRRTSFIVQSIYICILFGSNSRRRAFARNVESVFIA